MEFIRWRRLRFERYNWRMPDSAFAVTVIDWKIAPGTTSCLDCGAVLNTPDNVIPHAFATTHHGHNVQTRLAPTIRELERAVIEAAISYCALPVTEKTLSSHAILLEEAVVDLIAAREKQQ